jgi:hypothetical protein
LKEVIAMLWLYPDESLAAELSNDWVFGEMWSNATTSKLYDLGGFNEWPRRIESLSGIPEILECMVTAQKRCRDFIPLWRPRDLAPRDFNPRIDSFSIYDKKIGSASTAVQYHAVIVALCQGLEAKATHEQATFDKEHHSLPVLSDPCIHFLRCRFLGIMTPAPAAGIKPEFLEATESLAGKDLLETISASQWELWAFVWTQFSTRQKRKWCREARRKPDRIVSEGKSAPGSY